MKTDPVLVELERNLADAKRIQELVHELVESHRRVLDGFKQLRALSDRDVNKDWAHGVRFAVGVLEKFL
jgi:hypothetical protein